MLVGISFVINIIYIPLKVNPLVYNLQILTLFLFNLGPSFLLMFNFNLYFNNREISKKISTIYLLVFGAALFLILIFTNGIVFDESTNWRPSWNWNFFTFFSLFMLSSVILPNLILSYSIYRRFQNDQLKQKYGKFFLGIIGLSVAFHMLFLYNTWDNLIFRNIWSAISLMVVPAGILVYYGIAHDIKHHLPKKPFKTIESSNKRKFLVSFRHPFK